MPYDTWIEDARVRGEEVLRELSPEGARLLRQILRWLVGTARDPAPHRSRLDPRVLTRTRIRATRTLPHGSAELIDLLLFLGAVDAGAEPEPRRDELLQAWRPYVEGVLAGNEVRNPTFEHPGLRPHGRALGTVLASMRDYFRVGLYWWEKTGIPRRWLLQARGADRPKLARYLLTRFGGFRPVWSNHLPALPPGTHFTEAAFTHAHLEIARLLQRAPRVLGIASASWYYDPAVAETSPHLAFLPRIVRENGGFLFQVPLDAATREHALHGSGTRRALEARGTYVVRNYARVWDRRALLRWAERQAGWQASIPLVA